MVEKRDSEVDQGVVCVILLKDLAIVEFLPME